TSHAKSTTFCSRSPKYISIDLNMASLLLGAGPGSNITTFGGFTQHPGSTMESIL
ncbi:5434_t:CDS:1, partial [Dentiscutata heterogama]